MSGSVICLSFLLNEIVHEYFIVYQKIIENLIIDKNLVIATKKEIIDIKNLLYRVLPTLHRCFTRYTMSANIYVGNLPYSATDEELSELFEQYGAVVSAKVISDRETGRSRGFGFVEMEESIEAGQAIEELDGKDAFGRPLRVNLARPKGD